MIALWMASIVIVAAYAVYIGLVVVSGVIGLSK